jgi:hypothetical protein
MPDYNMFNSLACVYCGARQIKRISRYRIAQAEATRRMREVLDSMLAPPFLHNEMQIRALVKTGPWIEPLLVAVEPESKPSAKARKPGKFKTN